MAYTVVQVVGGVGGALLANSMFDRRVLEISAKERLTLGHLIGEVVATAGLVALIFALARTGRATSLPSGQPTPESRYRNTYAEC